MKAMAQDKNCKHCGANFEISDKDLAFFERISPVLGDTTLAIPCPTLCPSCRWQRRLCFRNERTLYRRKCDLTGRSMISMHPEDSPFPVYYISDWLGDAWDPLSYGREFDFSRPFFEQFKELCDSVPHFSLFIDPLMDENSEYTNCASESKNCYLISQAERNEDCYYSRGINNCKDCCDCLRVNHCELCYEGINLSNCYYCLYCQDSENSSDCYFSTDLRGCKNCFGCHGLNQKEYYIYNKPVSKKEWKEKVESLVFTHELISELKDKSRKASLDIPKRALRVIQCEDSVGDHLLQCRDAVQCFDSKDLEHSAYCYEVLGGARYAYDFSMWGIECELLYECCGCGYNVYNTLFSSHCWNNVSYLLYCESCFPSVKNCFGCFGLKRQDYCVFNKRYSKAEYEELVVKIAGHMLETGEWGEFFPPWLSSYGYNEALSGEFFSLAKPEVLSFGWNWREEAEGARGEEAVRRAISQSIKEVDDSICANVLLCEKTNKQYKIATQELRLYRKLGIPLPKLCPELRHKNRVGQRNPRYLWKRSCNKCSESIESTYAPEREEIVYCESCYLKELYA